MPVQELQVEVAERGIVLENSVPLVSIPTPGDNSGQVVACMIGGVAEVAPDHHRSVVQQRTTLLLDFIQLG